MKNSEIHNGLDKEDIRNFISENIAKTYGSIGKVNINPPLDNGNDPWETIINREQHMVNYYSERLKLYKELNSLLTIMKMCGWKEFDVSDSVIRDSHYDYYLNFIGTDKEYYELSLLLNNEKP